jgi:hypothetical protein
VCCSTVFYITDICAFFFGDAKKKRGETRMPLTYLSAKKILIVLFVKQKLHTTCHSSDRERVFLEFVSH